MTTRVKPWPGMTQEDVDRKIDKCAQKRDHACDVLNKPLLGLTYQQEIDDWLAVRRTLPALNGTSATKVTK